jgi:hypothetical protein
MVAVTLSSGAISDLTMIWDASMLTGDAVSHAVELRGVGRWNFTSNDAVTNGTGVPVGAFQPPFGDLPHDGSFAVTVENSRDDAAVQEAEPVAVRGTAPELARGEVAFPVAAEVEAVRVGVAASEAGQLRVQRFLDAHVRTHDRRLLPSD